MQARVREGEEEDDAEGAEEGVSAGEEGAAGREQAATANAEGLRGPDSLINARRGRHALGLLQLAVSEGRGLRGVRPGGHRRGGTSFGRSAAGSHLQVQGQRGAGGRPLAASADHPLGLRGRDQGVLEAAATARVQGQSRGRRQLRAA